MTGRTRDAAQRTSLLLVSGLVVAAACGSDTSEPTTVSLVDQDRHARFTADEASVVYYHHDEPRTTARGVYRVNLAGGDGQMLVEAILAGFDVDPRTDSIVFSAVKAGEAEPALWIMGLNGGSVRRLGGGGSGPGYRWPAFSRDGARIAWEIRYESQTGLDTANTLWIADWQDGVIASPRTIGPGRRSSWRPDGAALAVERRRPGATQPSVIVVLDTTGLLLDTLGLGGEPIWRPDGAMVAYYADAVADRGCLGVCFVDAGGGSPTALSSAFMSFPGTWSRDGAQFVYARVMRTYEIQGNPTISVEESRLWVRTLAGGSDRQLTF